MLKTTDFPLTKFRAALVAERLKPSTVGTYLANVRRALRRAAQSQAVTSEHVAQGLQDAPENQRALYLTAWRRFQAFAATVGQHMPDAPVLEAAGKADDLAALREWLPQLVAAMPITPKELFYLTIGRIKPVPGGGLFFYATPNPFAKKQPVPKFLPQEKIRLHHKLMRWAYPRAPKQMVPDSDAPYLPAVPEGDVPMPVRVLRNIINNGRKKIVDEQAIEEAMIARDLELQARIDRGEVKMIDQSSLPSESKSTAAGAGSTKTGVES